MILWLTQLLCIYKIKGEIKVAIKVEFEKQNHKKKPVI